MCDIDSSLRRSDGRPNILANCWQIGLLVSDSSVCVLSLESVVAVQHAGRVGLELVDAVGVGALDLPVGDAVGPGR